MIAARVTSARLRAGFRDQARFGASEIRWSKLPNRGDGGVRVFLGRLSSCDKYALAHLKSTEFRLRMGGKEQVWDADHMRVVQTGADFTISLIGKPQEQF